MRLQLDAPQRLPAPVVMLRGTPRAREVVSVRLHDGEGRLGCGESVPLPGYSRETAAQVHEVLRRVAAQAATDGWTDDAGWGDRRVEDAGREHCAPAAAAAVPASPAAWLDAALAPFDALLAASTGARFALECALVDLMARRAGLPAARWLAAGRALQPVPVSLLLPDDDAAAVDAARAGAAAGHTVLKLKVARADRTPAGEDRLLAALRAAADAGGAGVRLRLDANGALDAAQLVPRLAAWQRLGVELVEEPVAGAAMLALPPLPLPWAADESLVDPALAAALLALPAARRPAAFVLKPAELGLARSLRLADAAAASGLGLIVTHSLDGDCGHAAARALAAALPVAPWPCGLAPHPGLSRPLPHGPWLPPPSGPGLGGADTPAEEAT